MVIFVSQMILAPQLKRNITQIVVITICFVIINLFIALFNDTLIRSHYSEGPSSLYNFKVSILINLLIGLVAGILGGIVLVTVNGRYFRKKSFGYAMMSTALAFIIVFAIATMINSGILIYVNLHGPTSFLEFINSTFELIFNISTITYFILWLAITLGTLFLLQVNDKFGPGILIKFLKGNYHRPKEEQRIFMFVDMRSSTTIAEKLGNRLYFNLLSDLFADITNTIIDHEGEIYQYVGDEVVISWPIKKGVKNANCIKCYFQIQDTLNNLSSFYNNKYGISPQLKAGLHHGKVMAGEIGVIKKDIIYSGDVLNTTSRIQEQCNQYKVDLLISDETFNIIENPAQFELVPLGNIELRGRAQKININTVRFLPLNAAKSVRTDVLEQD